MAFAFVVEDGSGLASATSYVSVADADDYFALTPDFAATWNAKNNTDKEFLLGWATRVLDQKTVWNGVKTTTTQALRWPRTGVYDRDGLLIPSTTLPKQLIEATLEFAKWLNENDPTSGQDIDYLSRMRVDVIEFEFQENTSQSSFPSILNQIIGSLGTFKVGGGHRFVSIAKS